jgi:hypothetical protein
MIARLETSLEAMKRFPADASHELRGPFDRRDKSKAILRLVRRLQDLGCVVDLKHAA